jgi:hypothetical protein
MDKGVVAAKRRYPFRGQAIDERAARDDELRPPGNGTIAS